MKQSGLLGLEIDAMEKENEFKAKERERELTKLYESMNTKFRSEIEFADGIFKSKQRKIKKFLDPKKKEKMLFDGIRDQKIQCWWV